jgi:internalin A
MKSVLLSLAILLAFSLIAAQAGEVQSQPKLEIHKQSEERDEDESEPPPEPPPAKGMVVDAARHPNPEPEEREAVRAALEAGATVEYDATNHVRRIEYCERASDADLKLFATLKNLETLIVESPGVTDAGMTSLVAAKKLRVLSLRKTRVTDEGMKSVGQMANIESLGLCSDEITGKGMAHLGGLKRLVSLSIYDSGVDDDGMRKIAELPFLQRLRLSHQITGNGIAELTASKSLIVLRVTKSLTDRDMASVGKLTNLETLVAGFPDLTDEGLRQMNYLKRLRSLKLFDTKTTEAGMVYVGQMIGLEKLELNFRIGDEGLARLTKLTNLKELDLRDSRITDAGLAKLTAIPGLRRLNLEFTHVTTGGVAKLRGMKDLRINLSYTDITEEDIDKLNDVGVQASKRPRSKPRWNDR